MDPQILKVMGGSFAGGIAGGLLGSALAYALAGGGDDAAADTNRVRFVVCGLVGSIVGSYFGIKLALGK